jgi:hypothetical protein
VANAAFASSKIGQTLTLNGPLSIRARWTSPMRRLLTDNRSVLLAVGRRRVRIGI